MCKFAPAGQQGTEKRQGGAGDTFKGQEAGKMSTSSPKVVTGEPNWEPRILNFSPSSVTS